LQDFSTGPPRISMQLQRVTFMLFIIPEARQLLSGDQLDD